MTRFERVFVWAGGVMFVTSLAVCGYAYLIEMDADFSHDPREIPNMLKAIQQADLVLGSRYIDGFAT